MNRFTWIVAAAVLLLFVCVPAPAQTTIHVDDDAPNDPGPGDPSISDPLEDGSAAHPYDAIQEAIDAASHSVTVLVADGTYLGEGNRNMSFLGKRLTVRSANGPEACIVDCEGVPGEDRFGFEFVSNETVNAVLEGLTITNASGAAGSPGHGSGVHIAGSSPVVTGNHITACTGGPGILCGNSGARIIGNTVANNTNDATGTSHGGGIAIAGISTALVSGNTISGNSADMGGGISVTHDAAPTAPRIIGNLISGNQAVNGGGIYARQLYEDPVSPLIEGNRITDNEAGEYGGGIYLDAAEPASLANNLLAGNQAVFAGGGLYALNLDGDTLITTMSSCTVADNSVSDSLGDGGGVCLTVDDFDETCTVTLVDCILAGNQADAGSNLWLGGSGPSVSGSVAATLDHCLVQDGAATIRVGHMTLVQASPVLTDDPLFAAGPAGDYLLAQTAAGQPADSPALDAGSDLATNICTSGGDETICLDTLTTRTDQGTDSGTVDLGYHYPSTWTSVLVSFTCSPDSGTLPFQTVMQVVLTNAYEVTSRRIAGRINVELAGGQSYGGWRAGFTNVGPGEAFSQAWPQHIPALGSLVGNNVFTLLAMDVTPAPFNQPPNPPSGDTDTAACTVTGVAP